MDRSALRVFGRCCPITSGTLSFNLLVCCFCDLVERLVAIVNSTYSSVSSEDSGDVAVRYGGAVSILGILQVNELGELSTVQQTQVRGWVDDLSPLLVIVAGVVLRTKLRL